MANIQMERAVKILACAAFVMGILVVVSDARVFTGSMNSKNNWQFFSRFCFVGNEKTHPQGHVSWSVGNTHSTNTLLLSYWDQPNVSMSGSWKAVYKNKALTCAQKISHAANEQNVSQIHGGQFDPANNYNHFWWFVFADCSATSQTIDYYQITLLQWDGSQLSCDEIGLPAMYIVFFVFYLLILAAHVYCAYQLYRQEALHPIVRIISVAIGVQFLSIFFSMIHWTTLQRNGVGVEGLKAFGDLLNMLMDLAVILLMFLISKGWAVTTNVIPKRDTTIILVSMAVLIVLYLALFIWDYVTADSALIYYFYQSVPGIMILVLRGIAGLWFLWNIFHTLKLETLPEKRMFYVRWAIIFGSWIAILPLIVLIFGTQHVWLRLKAISATSEVFDFILMIILVIHTWPTLARRYFSVMPGKTLLGYDFLSGESQSYSGVRTNFPNEGSASNPFSSTSDL